jgi:serine protease Do
VAGTVALGTVAIVNHTGVHAATAYGTPIDPSSVTALTALDQAVETVASRVTPSVVNIAVTSTPNAAEQQQMQGQGMGLPPGWQQFFGGNGSPFGGQQQQQRPQLVHGIGSGVIISPDGYIVTNNHVVDGAKEIKVTLNDRRILNGKVVGVDKLTDLAVVKVNANDLPAIAWGDSTQLKPGESVMAFGSPFGSLQFSVTRGIVSAVNRPNSFSNDARTPGGLIQVDAAINPGNSGGPLVNAYGELVGINNGIITESGSFAGAGFAIPSQIVKTITTQLIAHGKVDHGYLGISMNDVTPDNAHFFKLRDDFGAIIAQVTPDSPASRAGLQNGDVIVAENGHKVLNGSELQVDVAETSPGNSITLGIVRNGEPQNIRLTVGEYRAPGTSETADNDGSDGASGNSGKLGLAVANLDSDTRQQLQLPAQVHGVAVQQVRPDSPADDAGIAAGDVILEVNRQPVTSAQQFVNQVHAAGSGDLLMLVWSKGNASYRTVRPSDQNG